MKTKEKLKQSCLSHNFRDRYYPALCPKCFDTKNRKCFIIRNMTQFFEHMKFIHGW